MEKGVAWAAVIRAAQLPVTPLCATLTLLTDKTLYVSVGHQTGENLGQLGFQVCVQLGFNVEPVHIREDRDDPAKRVEVLHQSLPR